jgi:hypothetical protein
MTELNPVTPSAGVPEQLIAADRVIRLSRVIRAILV